MNLVEKAIIFATKAHEGQKRKMGNIPYILHPLEVATIISTISEDEELITSGILHDVVEDCGIDPKEIRNEFGSRVYKLVLSDTEDRESKRSEEETWLERKQYSLLMLENTKDLDVKIMWLADKLSNMRSIYRKDRVEPDNTFSAFHQKDPLMHKWYYDTIIKNLVELKDTAAYVELVFLFHKVFDKYN